MIKLIISVSPCGYTVQTINDGEIIDEYDAGNSPHCSATYLPADEGVGVVQLLKFALITAKEKADELGEPHSIIAFENDDDSLSLGDHAELWAAENGETVPSRESEDWNTMYERWITYAFKDSPTELA